ncbi:HNH endonuclease signature motif containing protein [Geofilum sp. OHC36d9]|uniref:HNH endonuclease signature motif containing protein n=1 Tax=Geofilum sp. OHC36d9 TaxID=3458413 RepID=UPI004033A852
MARNHNSDRNGSGFNDNTKRQVWNKAQIVPGVNSNTRRKDICGAWIEWNNYGDTTEDGTGWEIDHIKPVAKGGNDLLSNLQPLQWQNNRKKSDDYPASNYCAVSALKD